MIKTNLAFGLRAIGLPLVLALALILGRAAGPAAPPERPAVTASR